MGLSLTSTAGLHLDHGARGAACLARGLDGQELVIDAQEAREVLAADASASVAHIVALRVAGIDSAMAPAIALLARRWQVPVSVPAEGLDRDQLAAVGSIFGAAGARLCIGHGTDLADTLALSADIATAGATGSLGLCWEVRPSIERLDDAGAVLLAARTQLGLVRLYGGGPEQHDQGGQGIGSLLTDLALSQYSGLIVLVPSAPAHLPRWHAWLESRKPTGCGSGHDEQEIVLDVRGVEPKDRLETILGAYRRLRAGATLKLTVDHDPSCMYYMLEATEPAGSFAFATTEHGPDSWRAEVRRTFGTVHGVGGKVAKKGQP
jgi:uncharacterized protein (DUF2249 family)